MPRVPDLAREQVLANESSLPYFAAFAEHRRRLTQMALEAAGTKEAPSLCILGAGNCFDLDLNALAARYPSIHLVDIDGQALERAFDRQDQTTQRRLALHAPVDLSGCLDRIHRWSRFEVTPRELLNHAQVTALQIREKLADSFDVVLSCCLLSQMQLSVLDALTDRHRLFQAVRLTLNVTHLRTLSELTKIGGTALFATDASSSELHPLHDVPPDADCRELLSGLVRQHRVFDFADPTLLASQVQDDPALRRAFNDFQARDAWVWNNGPHAQFLVYACLLQRR